MKKKQTLRLNLVSLAMIATLLMAASLLLPWLNTLQMEGQKSYSAVQLLSASFLKLLPLVIAAAASAAVAILAVLRPRKGLLIVLAAALAASVLAGVYALLTAKETADATGLLAQPFMVRDLSLGIWVFLGLAIVALFLTLSAMREPTEYIILTVMASVWLLPIIWLVLTAFRQEPGAYTTYLLPKNYTADNFTRLFTETSQFNFPRWYMNTLVVAIFTCALTTIMVLMISYTFSRLRFPARKALMNIGLILGMFPGFMSMIAVYHILKAIGLAKSLISLVLVYSGGGAMGYFVAKGFFDTIPRSLDEAATIDGASRNTVFWKIILPSSQPIIVYTAITAFIAPWVDFIFVSVIMKDDYQNYTVALGLYRMLEREHIYEYFTRFCAGAVLVAIPITLLFIKIQKFYVEGVTGGAVKG